MYDPWTGKLSDYLDDELGADERQAVEAHLVACPDCARTLDELRRVVEQARSLVPRPPEADLWEQVSGRIGAGARSVSAFRPHERRRLSFTVPQLAAASLLIATVSAGIAWRVRTTPRAGTNVVGEQTPPAALAVEPASAPAVTAPGSASVAAPEFLPVSLADAQYDAAVADLQRALDKGRDKLDKATIAIVEQNLRIIDRAIEQAREALVADPANAYLSGHLVETRRKKLDLMRRAAALTEAD